jgi:putative two-component system response regulator
VTRSIFLLEDDPGILKFLEHLFKSEKNYKVITAGTVREALQIISTRPDIALFITDWQLLNGKALDVIKELRTWQPNCPVVVISGYNVEVDALRGGANLFLKKPFSPELLKLQINALMDATESRRRLDSPIDIEGAFGTALEAKDEYTRGHSDRVWKVAKHIYSRCFPNDTEEEEILKAGCHLHDIGKIGTPDNILNAPRKLTEDEFKIIKQHPITGWEICRNLKSIRRETLNIIRHHHELLDGTGYPDNLDAKHENMTALVQIVCIADKYEALTSDRSYRDAFDHDQAMKILKEEVEQGKINKIFVQELQSFSNTLSEKAESQE